jgi:uncharacterized protein (DUF1697 family)
MTFVALFRAVNVSGRNKIPMARLRALLEGLGLRDVRTYLQSGNAVFGADADAGSAQELATAIEVRIERDLGPRVGVLVVPADRLAAVVTATPFLSADEATLYATFLFGSGGDSDFGQASEAVDSAVCEAAFRKLELPAIEGEEAAFVGVPPLAEPVVYLKLPHGYGRSKLNNAYFERRFGVAATTRNWRTIRALVEMGAGG